MPEIREKTEWEYHVLVFKQPYTWGGVQRELSELGEEGWELVAVHNHEDIQAGYVFKRPKPPAA
jgi:hypothetical protein